MYDPRKRNFFKKLIEMVEQGKIPSVCCCGVDVYHDDWCHIHRGGYCNGNPEVQVRLPAEWN